MAFYDTILHLDSPGEDKLKLVLHNAMNFLNALPGEDFTLQIIANGGGATLLLNSRPHLHELAKPVLARGVILKICANAMAANNISSEEIWPECEIVPAGLVEIVRLQKAGYSYIKP